jgi:hypothetical protein
MQAGNPPPTQLVTLLSSWFWTAMFYVSGWRIAVDGDSFACMPSFACRGRVRLLTCLLCMLGAVLILLLMQTPQLYARNTVRTSVSVAADEAGCTIAGCTIVTVFCMLLVIAVYSYWDAVRSEPKQRGPVY